MHTILGSPGYGSVIVEAAFELAQIPYRVDYLNLTDSAEDRVRLAAVNPLGQVPTLVLADGRITTESAAIVLMAAESVHGHVLAPPAGHPDRGKFLHWLVFLVASIYPTFTYGDDPGRYVPADAVASLRDSTDRQREAMWRQVEAASTAPWFLGDRRSAIDLYVWAMVHWRPRRPWFVAETPKLATIADKVDAEPMLAEVRRRNGWAG